MYAKYKDQLPTSLRALVDEIETAAGVEIEVKQVSDIAPVFSGVEGPPTMAANLWFGTDAGNAQGIRLQVAHISGIASSSRPYLLPYPLCPRPCSF